MPRTGQSMVIVSMLTLQKDLKVLVNQAMLGRAKERYAKAMEK